MKFFSNSNFRFKSAQLFSLFFCYDFLSLLGYKKFMRKCISFSFKIDDNFSCDFFFVLKKILIFLAKKTIKN